MWTKTGDLPDLPGDSSEPTAKAPPVSRAPAAPSPLKPSLLPWAWAAGLCLLYATVALRRHFLLRTTGYDLGIFEQAVRAYSELRAPVVPLRGEDFNLLGDHFHPLLAVLAPLYRIWPSASCLLVAQSALLALAVVPLARWARRVLGTWAAHAVAAGYGLSWGIASAAAFDFHEIAFAVPLLAFSLEALGRRRWGVAVAWAAPLLLVKEDLGLTVAAIGVYIAVKGSRRLGVVTALGGILGSVLAIKVLLPAVNPAGEYYYGGNLPDTDGSLLTTLAMLPIDALQPEVKAVTLVLVFAPSALLALRSPLALIAVPTLAWRLLSENSSHWGTAYHYSAVLMPVVFAALVDALSVWGREPYPLRVRQLRASLLTVLAVTAVLVPSFPLAQVAAVSTWRADPHVGSARALLERIPDGATVAASNRLVPQLTSRCSVVVFPTYPVDEKAPRSPLSFIPQPTAEWIVHDREAPEGWLFRQGHWPYRLDVQESELRLARQVYGYELVAEGDGVTLLRRRSM
ncbi:DUF2079 domain-containing protein [Streptomyces sp. NPDC047971]|uniref:DUF2079 domain-containing protein n=1 Tax=Streptomyces sp. NPDC047971 TaxID=3154499 RepID=UPI0033E75F53